MCELSFLRMRSPWLWAKFGWYLSGKGFDYDKSFAYVKKFTQEVIIALYFEFIFF